MHIRNARIFSVVVGFCDATTGALLIFAPSIVVSLLRFSKPPIEPVYFQFIGVFVLATGLYYWVPLIVRDGVSSIDDLKLIWIVTALVRTLVAVFVLAQIFFGALCIEWLTVAAVDAVIAILQVVLLRRGLLREL